MNNNLNFSDNPFKKSKLTGTNCDKCGRTIDDSGLCRCDPDWISPAETNADKKVSELANLLLEIRAFLVVQTGEAVAEIDGKVVMQCRGCAQRWIRGDEPIHHAKCWPYFTVNRIDEYMKGNNLV